MPDPFKSTAAQPTAAAMGPVIEIVTETDVVPWRYTDPATKVTYASVFLIRIVPKALQKRWRKEHTTYERSRHGREENFDWQPFVDKCLDYAITGWEGVQRQGVNLECTAAWKSLLPEPIRTEIIRLCAGFELGQVMEGEAPSLGEDEPRSLMAEEGGLPDPHPAARQGD